MKSVIYLLFLSLFCALQVVAQSDYQRVRIYTNEENFHDLITLGIDLDHVQLIKNTYIDHDFSPHEFEQIQNSGLNYKVLYSNASDYYPN